MEDISRSSEDVQLDWREARERLKEFREAKNRDSLTVLKIGKPLVEKNRSRLGDEREHRSKTSENVPTNDFLHSVDSFRAIVPRRLGLRKTEVGTGKRTLDTTKEFLWVILLPNESFIPTSSNANFPRA